jgi:hypothetical protein
MKKILFLICVLLLVLAKASYSKEKPLKEVKVISAKKQILYFKVDKSFVGGWVEVYDETKGCIEADSLSHTHTMIYFDEMPKGVYVIRVKKGDQITEFKYNNI